MNLKTRRFVIGALFGLSLCLPLNLTGCGGGGSSSSDEETNPPDPDVTTGDPAAVGGAESPEPN